MDTGYDLSPLRLSDDSGPSPSAPEVDQGPCLLCERVPTWICAQCTDGLCSVCWDKIPAHRKVLEGRRGPRARPHEKVDLKVYYRLSEIFEPRNIASQKDTEWEAGAKWFYVSRTANGDFRLGDMPRFRQLTAPRRENQCAEQFPSLVSFIGQTGNNTSQFVPLLDHGIFANRLLIKGRGRAPSCECFLL